MNSKKSSAATALAVISIAALVGCSSTPERAAENTDGGTQSAPPRIGAFEKVAENTGMWSGIAVSAQGRKFVSFPKWGDDGTPYTVAEIVDGKTVAYPDAAHNAAEGDAATRFISPLAVVIDAQDRLWVLDTGSVEWGPVVPGGPKLVQIDLKSNKVERTIVIGPDAAPSNSYLNDVRFDLNRGPDGTAYITDSGSSALIVVDLATGAATRRLAGTESVSAVPEFTPMINDKPMMTRYPGSAPGYVNTAADGIALSHDGKTLYYSPMTSRHLYSIDAALLADPAQNDATLAKAVVDQGVKGVSDGMTADDKGNLYTTDQERNQILRRLPDGRYETQVQDPGFDWIDSVTVAEDGYLYFTVNQLNALPPFNDGKDMRQKPLHLYRTKVDAGPA
ncbi:L-dopachrome tautomerase-related protein [Nocardia sp. NBC_00511]|uniref:L-dopachrome tautomerase-related protein n=1 Tax=Nocardia sp. NBC_00511 TaxID=2903591 RepID=UPI0030E33376